MEEQKGSRLLIYNPCSGTNKDRPALNDLLALLQSDGRELTVHSTQYPGHAKELAETYGGDCSEVIVCGGDGTLNETVTGLLKIGARLHQRHGEQYRHPLQLPRRCRFDR